MTSERRLLIGFDDIRAITLECKRCGVRLTIAPEKANPDDYVTCPGCRTSWITRRAETGRTGGASFAFLHLLPELVQKAAPDADTRDGVRILFEVSDPT